jgi:hypothetical protein
MADPIRFQYAGKWWIMALKPRGHDGALGTVKTFRPDGHDPPMHQFLAAVKAFNRRLDARAGHG